jgi:hypothetical protein
MVDQEKPRSDCEFAQRNRRGLLTTAVPALAGVLTAAGSVGLIWRPNQGLHQALARQRRGAYFQRIAPAERGWAANNLSRMEELLGRCPEDLRGWEWHPSAGAARPSRSWACALTPPRGRGRSRPVVKMINFGVAKAARQQARGA